MIATELQAAAAKEGKPITAIHPEAMDKLLRHDWLGNLRELSHTVRTMTLFCNDSVILPEHVVFPSDLNPIARQQELKSQSLCLRAITRKPMPLLISHSNTPCKSTFGSFTNKRIGTSDARPVYSVSLARRLPAIFARCPKIKHILFKSEARRPNNAVGISLQEVAISATGRNRCSPK